uniref:Uncharacterized protein n=1 Tax=Cannabis sativa TaxID=3483 RepID=A0A803QE85_CANSA
MLEIRVPLRKLVPICSFHEVLPDVTISAVQFFIIIASSVVTNSFITREDLSDFTYINFSFSLLMKSFGPVKLK